MSLLKKHFISSFSLVLDLQELKNDPCPEVAELAKISLDNYSFPVMMMIQLPNGTIVTKINANELLDMNPGVFESGFFHPSSLNYQQFLEKGIQKSSGYL